MLGHNDEENEQQLLVAVLTCSYQRVLSRIRSSHRQISRKTLNKRPVTELFVDCMQNGRFCDNIPRAKIDRIKAHATNLHKIFNTFEASAIRTTLTENSQAPLARLVEEACNLSQTQDLHRVLRGRRYIDPSLIAFILDSLGKIGRYFAITRAFHKAARNKKNTIFRNVAVAVTQASKVGAVYQIPASESLESSIDSIRAYSGPETKFKKGVYGDLSRANILFSQAKASCDSKKIHAEIQLLSFYEKTSLVKPPRIICASKSACFLCNLFIRIHGRFVPQGSHRKVYPLWTVPDSTCDTVMERMNQELERRILVTFGRPARQRPQYQNESVLNSICSWTSPTTSHTVSTSSESLHSPSLHTVTPFQDVSSEDSDASDMLTKISSDDSTSTVTELEPPNLNRAGLSPSVVAQDSQSQGAENFQIQKHAFSSRSPFFRYLTNSVELNCELEVEPAQEKADYFLQFRHCNKLESAHGQATTNAPVIDLNSMEPGTEIVTQDGAPKGDGHRFLRFASDYDMFDISFRKVFEDVDPRIE